jgi:uncharacterized protein YcsI (UPF0317 family)
MTPHELRLACRKGSFEGLTTGLCSGFLQANLVILPAALATDFKSFCEANAQACPLLAKGEPGDPSLSALGVDIDVRTDLPRYEVIRPGIAPTQRHDIRDLWQEDSVAFAIGCWFSAEAALLARGIRLRHVELGIQGGLFRTSRPSKPIGAFGGPLVVSMRPFAAQDVPAVEAITAMHPEAHGAPVAVGEENNLGIADLSQPDFGEVLLPLPGEVPVFWACGLTATEAARLAAPDILITHAPGAMLVTDLTAR